MGGGLGKKGFLVTFLVCDQLIALFCISLGLSLNELPQTRLHVLLC